MVLVSPSEKHKKDLVGYGVSLMGGVEAPGRGLIAGHLYP